MHSKTFKSQKTEDVLAHTFSTKLAKAMFVKLAFKCGVFESAKPPIHTYQRDDSSEHFERLAIASLACHARKNDCTRTLVLSCRWTHVFAWWESIVHEAANLQLDRVDHHFGRRYTTSRAAARGNDWHPCYWEQLRLFWVDKRCVLKKVYADSVSSALILCFMIMREEWENKSKAPNFTDSELFGGKCYSSVKCVIKLQDILRDCWIEAKNKKTNSGDTGGSCRQHPPLKCTSS